MEALSRKTDAFHFIVARGGYLGQGKGSPGYGTIYSPFFEAKPDTCVSFYFNVEYQGSYLELHSKNDEEVYHIYKILLVSQLMLSMIVTCVGKSIILVYKVSPSQIAFTQEIVLARLHRT